MKGNRTPWWGGIIFFIIVLNIFTDSGVSLVPVIIMGAIIYGVLRNTGVLSGSRQQGQRPVPPHEEQVTLFPPPHGAPQPVDDSPGLTPGPPGGGALPRIDVPRYPGEEPPLPSPAPPSPGWASTTPIPPPAPAASTSYPSPTTDPVVSLGQLHLGRLGRELQTAASSGAGADVARLLTEIDDLGTRMVTMLSGAQGMPGSGRKEFESGLRRLEREVGAARGEVPAGSRVARVVRTCTAMGQTGRYE